ncbi:MAG TPA: hypothetical protein PLV33_00210 [Opitutaceae bacterium]|nr:hypothetical protein [Opitutaceae bacterium]HOR23700.1 hypothetical protein [Opitutaceae bacterium]HPK48560.1 hypothetical protein [Opitutaceae bacterium]
MSDLEFRPPKWIAVIFFAGAIGAAAVAYFYSTSISLVWFYSGFAVLCLAAAIGSLRTRVVLRADRLDLVAEFRHRTVQKEDIESVSWAKGCPACVKTKDGKVLKLPSIGFSPQSLCHAINAWKKA